jgi:hypothetical protein
MLSEASPASARRSSSRFSAPRPPFAIAAILHAVEHAPVHQLHQVLVGRGDRDLRRGGACGPASRLSSPRRPRPRDQDLEPAPARASGSAPRLGARRGSL